MICNIILNTGNCITLKPEVEKGNIEYKLRLDYKDEISLCKLETQLKWRIREGKQLCGRYEAIYVFGIMDDGNMPCHSENITETVIDQSIEIFDLKVKRINCKIFKKEKYIIRGKMIGIVKVGLDMDTGEKLTETNVLFIGPSGTGKTTLLSRLTYDQDDNGNGYSRNMSLKHEHEKKYGITSDIKMDFIGFKGDELVNYFTGMGSAMEDIYSMSDRYVSLTDLPGDYKYIRTIIYGILSSKGDIIVITVPSDAVNECMQNNKKMYQDIVNICKLSNKNPVILLTRNDLVTDNNANYLDVVTTFFNDLGLAPVNTIKVSTINSNECDEFIKYICDLSKKFTIDSLDTITDAKLFITNQVFNVSSGAILYGYVKMGKISIGDTINIFCNGKIIKRSVKSIQKKMVESKYIECCETGCIQFHNLRSSVISKTSVVISDTMFKFLTDIAIFIPVDGNNIPPKKSYLMFNGSTVQTVDLYYDGEYKFKSTNKTKLFILPDTVTVLKDETHHTYIGKSTLYKSES